MGFAGSGFDGIVWRSKHYEEHPMDFFLERIVRYPYIIRIYLMVDVAGRAVPITPNETRDYWAQLPEDISLMANDTVFEKYETVNGVEALKNYRVVLNDSLIYQKAKALTSDDIVIVYPEVAEFNIETNRRSSPQMSGMFLYPKDGNLQGLS